MDTLRAGRPDLDTGDIPAEFFRDLERVRESNRALYEDIVEELGTDNPDDEYLDALLDELSRVLRAHKRQEGPTTWEKYGWEKPVFKEAGIEQYEQEDSTNEESSQGSSLARHGWRSGLALLVGLLLLLGMSQGLYMYTASLRTSEHLRALLSPNSPLQHVNFDMGSLTQEPFLNFRGYHRTVRVSKSQSKGESSTAAKGPLAQRNTSTTKIKTVGRPLGLGQLVRQLQTFRPPTLFSLVPTDSDWTSQRTLIEAIRAYRRHQNESPLTMDTALARLILADVNYVLQNHLRLPVRVFANKAGNLKYRLVNDGITVDRKRLDALCQRVWDIGTGK